jgi:hypothetical protein
MIVQRNKRNIHHINESGMQPGSFFSPASLVYRTTTKGGNDHFLIQTIPLSIVLFARSILSLMQGFQVDAPNNSVG